MTDSTAPCAAFMAPSSIGAAPTLKAGLSTTTKCAVLGWWLRSHRSRLRTSHVEDALPSEDGRACGLPWARFRLLTSNASSADPPRGSITSEAAALDMVPLG